MKEFAYKLVMLYAWSMGIIALAGIIFMIYQVFVNGEVANFAIG